MRFCVVGAGNIGAVHVRALGALPGARVTVVCDTDETRGPALASQCGGLWVSHYQEAVSRDDVDAVCVCTPSGTHLDVAIAAARAGKHLAIEKPLEVTLERIDRIIEAVKQAGVLMTCILPFRFRPGARRAKEAVEGGRLGRLVLADVHVKWHRPQEYYHGTWRGTWALDGGGVLMNQSIHNVDLLQWLGGPVKSVFGYTCTLTHRIETEDTALAGLLFRNGALGVIQASTSCWPGDPARLELHGEKGTIMLEEGRVARWALQGGDRSEEDSILGEDSTSHTASADPRAIGHECHARQLADLVTAVERGIQPAVSGVEARKAVGLILAVYRAARTGLPVSLE